MRKINVLDSLIGFISPRAGAQRTAWRQTLNELRGIGYDAGSHTKSNKNWRVVNESAELTDRFDRDTVRARARDMERNSDMANSIISAYKRNVIGKGYVLQARTEDEELNKQLEELWKEWCKKKNCDVTETQSLSAMLRMAEQRKRVDGGIILKKCYVQSDFLPFKLQALEVDELDHTIMTPKDKKNKVVGGIEYNEYNKAIGYWIRQYDIDGYTIKDPVYVDAKEIIFMYTKKRPSQIREMSDMAQTLTRIRDTNEFMVAVSLKQRIEACLAIFIRKALPTAGLGRGVQESKAGRKANYEGLSITPGMIKELNDGDEIQTVNPSGQATDAEGYITTQQKLMAAGQGLSYETASRDMSHSTYSSARQGSIEDEQTFIEDKELIEELLDEIYETFVISCVLKGLIKVRNFWDNKKKYFKHEWVQQPKRWIEPAKETNAQKTALQSGQKTFQQIAAENGKDWRDQIDEMAEVINYGNKKGLDMGGIIYGTSYNEPDKGSGKG